MNIWSFLFFTAVSASSSSSTQENKLIRVVVNNTESEPSPCLRAEFTAEVNIYDLRIYKVGCVFPVVIWSEFRMG